MKTNRLFTAICLLAGVLLAGSCSQNELTDGMVQDLPEGMYPLQISSVTLEAEVSAQPWGADAPQTRVTEYTDGNSSVWQNGDKIKVQIGDATPGTYTYQSGNLNIADGDTPAYWASKANDQTITAWYTSSGNGTVNLGDQTNSLAYAVKAQTTANFNQQVSLTFSHALAKVRVELTGEIASFVDNVSIKSYTTCTFTQGTLSNGANEGEIKMYKVADKTFEANVYPGCQIKEVKANDGEWSTLTTSVTPEAAKVHKIEIEISGTTIKLSDQTDEYIVESGKSLIIDGGSQAQSKRIVIKENAKVMLKNVKLKAPSNDNVSTIEIEGTATLLLSGTNEISGSLYGCPLTVTRGTLTINGTDNDQLTLVGGASIWAGCLGLVRSSTNLIINGGNIVADGRKGEAAGIGSYYAGDKDCGFITINGGTIKAYGGSGSAGIGAGNQCKSGDINITGGNIIAIGGGGNGGAGIGSSSAGSCGNITISGKNTVVTATAGSNSSDDIGGTEGGSCGTVTITDATVTATNGRIHGH